MCVWAYFLGGYLYDFLSLVKKMYGLEKLKEEERMGERKGDPSSYVFSVVSANNSHSVQNQRISI